MCFWCSRCEERARIGHVTFQHSATQSEGKTKTVARRCTSTGRRRATTHRRTSEKYKVARRRTRRARLARRSLTYLHVLTLLRVMPFLESVKLILSTSSAFTRCPLPALSSLKCLTSFPSSLRALLSEAEAQSASPTGCLYRCARASQCALIWLLCACAPQTRQSLRQRGQQRKMIARCEKCSSLGGISGCKQQQLRPCVATIRCLLEVFCGRVEGVGTRRST